jgi:hypothetical protein
MGSPISSTLAEIYLQYLEEIYVKHYLENKEITFYKKYADNIPKQNKWGHNLQHD